ncbi:hypothetical protein ABIB35_000607 [Arthrobacter sp. UYP6]
MDFSGVRRRRLAGASGPVPQRVGTSGGSHPNVCAHLAGSWHCNPPDLHTRRASLPATHQTCTLGELPSPQPGRPAHPTEPLNQRPATKPRHQRQCSACARLAGLTPTCAHIWRVPGTPTHQICTLGDRPLPATHQTCTLSGARRSGRRSRSQTAQESPPPRRTNIHRGCGLTSCRSPGGLTSCGSPGGLTRGWHP